MCFTPLIFNFYHPTGIGKEEEKALVGRCFKHFKVGSTRAALKALMDAGKRLLYSSCAHPWTFRCSRYYIEPTPSIVLQVIKEWSPRWI